MTDQITVPRATWDAMREALDELADLVEASLKGEYTPDSFTTQPARTAITAAASVSHPKPETTPPQEGGAITAESAANAIHPQATEPAGYKLVPVEPTREMLVALVCTGLRNTSYEEGRARFMEEMAQGYGAMLAAAPEAKQ